MPAGDPFDVVAALAILEHIPDVDQPEFATGCEARLKRGGRLVLTVPSPRVDDVLRILKTVRVVDGMHEEQHHRYDPHKAVVSFERAGLVLERHSTFELGLNHLLVFRKP
jgi:2-polyprenyl-3-methyl-5-hydroxy-6-metoxy-1,4-benzoquinol methylase